MEKKYFIFRKEWRDAISGLPEEVRLEVYDAIMEYGLSGRLSDLKPMARLAFNFVKGYMDGDVEREEHRRRISLVRSEAGKKGGRPKTHISNSQADELTEDLEKQNKANEKQNESKQKQTESKIKQNKANTPKEKDENEETPPTPPKEEKEEIEKTRVITPASAHDAFLMWLETDCPYLFGHLKLPTEDEFAKLKQRYGSEAIADCCLQMENRRDLRKTYVSLYRTLLNWLKRREDGTYWNYDQRPTPADNIRAAQESCYRDMAATLVGTPTERR